MSFLHYNILIVNIIKKNSKFKDVDKSKTLKSLSKYKNQCNLVGRANFSIYIYVPDDSKEYCREGR